LEFEIQHLEFAVKSKVAVIHFGVQTKLLIMLLWVKSPKDVAQERLLSPKALRSFLAGPAASFALFAKETPQARARIEPSCLEIVYIDVCISLLAFSAHVRLAWADL
jgi:hypothetical protein